MIDLKARKGLPNAIQVDGEAFELDTDFRVWLDFPNAIAEVYEGKYDKYIALFKDRANIARFSQETIEQLHLFYYQKPVLPKDSSNGDECIDYDLDADYIYAAFVQAYGIDLTEDELHWHKFMALLNAIPGETTLSAIMSYRMYDGDDKKMKEQKYRWSLPMKFTEEEQKKIDAFEKLFG